MDSFEWNHTVLVVFAVLVSLTRIVRMAFAALRVCLMEYYEFRVWLRRLQQRTSAPHEGPRPPS